MSVKLSLAVHSFRPSQAKETVMGGRCALCGEE